MACMRCTAMPHTHANTSVTCEHTHANKHTHANTHTQTHTNPVPGQTPEEALVQSEVNGRR